VASPFLILFLGGGKRVSLAQRFISAGLRGGLEVRVMSYDLTEHEPICTVGQAIRGLKWSDPDVDNDILRLVESYSVSLVVSNVDPATIVHSRLRDSHSAFEFTSQNEVALSCLEKTAFQSRCEEIGLPIAPLADGTQFPLFAKPITGSSSKGAQVVRDRTRFDELRSESNPYIFQQYVAGQEFSVDAYADRGGSIHGISPRTRDVVVGGEVEVSTTVTDEEITEASRIAIARLGLVGPLTLQFIREASTGSLYLIEVNPRFGGGVPVSIEAGFDFPTMMISEALGRSIQAPTSTRHIRMTRYSQEYFHAADS
jgi:carbamoyl-phosphate synthase large subunit